MSDPQMIKEIMEAVSIPVRAGTFEQRRERELTDVFGIRSWPSPASDTLSRLRSSRRSVLTTSTSELGCDPVVRDGS